VKAFHIGVDIGFRRDTSAVVGVYHDFEVNRYCMGFSKIWEAPVHIPAVTEYIIDIMGKETVAGVWYDPYQWAAEAQRLEDKGMGRYLNEVNQSGPFMIQIGTNLHTLMQRDAIWMYPDAELRSHFSWCAVKMTEQGPRIIKSVQTKQIDGVIATSMAVWGASQADTPEDGGGFDDSEHVVDLEELL